MKRVFFNLILILIASCSDNGSIIINQGGNQKAEVSFSQATALFEETDLSLDLLLPLSKAAPGNGAVTIQVSEISADYGSDYTLEPVPVGGQIILDITKGDTQVGFRVNAIQDTDGDTEMINFSITNVDGDKLSKGTLLSMDLSIQDQSTVDPKYQACISPLSENELSVVTWNLEQFPISDNVTVDLVEEIIENLDADIIAVQEISGKSDFNTLVSRLEGYQGAYYDVDNGLELGYIYKTSEISSFSSLSIIYQGENSAFPREPVVATATHVNGLEVQLINLHLKCCGDGEERRENASVLLKQYIDDNLSMDNVIVLGDFNDDIESGSPFTNFIEDSDNYYFADTNIASGSSINWSYPSWPSHIDHVLISNELEDNLKSVQTIKLENCLPEYTSSVSDHRPVMATFGN